MKKGIVCIYVGKMTENTLHATNASSEECGVDDCEGELEDNSKATINLNNHESNVIDDTEYNIGIMFKLEGNDVKVSVRVSRDSKVRYCLITFSRIMSY